MGRKTKSRKEPDKCIKCDAICCRNLAMLILKPTTKTDIQEVTWYLHFDTVSVFIRNHRWYILVKGNCIYLDKKDMCTIYDRRPDRCRRHPSDECEMTGDYYDVMFDTPEEFEEYLSRQKKKKKKKKR